MSNSPNIPIRKRRSDYKDGFKDCEGCGVRMRRNPAHSWDIWEQKRFCSISCSHTKRERRTPEKTFRKFCPRGRANECWEWLGTIGSHNYGQVKIDGVLWSAHRLSWVVHHGEISEGLWVLHRCDNPPCVNPKHLFLGTLADNVADMVNKKRHGHGEMHAHAKLRNRDVIYIRKSREPTCDLARKYKVSDVVIRNVRSKRSWKHV